MKATGATFDINTITRGAPSDFVQWLTKVLDGKKA
jgi:hypothetical protein